MERRNAWKDYRKNSVKTTGIFWMTAKQRENVSASLYALQSRQDTAIWQMLLKKVES